MWNVKFENLDLGLRKCDFLRKLIFDCQWQFFRDTELMKVRQKSILMMVFLQSWTKRYIQIGACNKWHWVN